MEHRISDTLTPKAPALTVAISTHLFTAIGQTDKRHWESLFQQFRLNLQSRMAGSDDRDLTKLQGKIEYVNELDTFFQSLVTAPPSK